MVVAPWQLHTEQQYWKWNSTIPAHNFFTEAIERMFLAYFRNPNGSRNLGSYCFNLFLPIQTVINLNMEIPAFRSSIKLIA